MPALDLTSVAVLSNEPKRACALDSTARMRHAQRVVPARIIQVAHAECALAELSRVARSARALEAVSARRRVDAQRAVTTRTAQARRVVLTVSHLFERDDVTYQVQPPVVYGDLNK